MFHHRLSSQDINYSQSPNHNQENILDHRSPQYLPRNKLSLSKVEDADRQQNGESYSSPFRMMANQNLLKQSQSFKDLYQPSNFKQSSNIFQNPEKKALLNLQLFGENDQMREGTDRQLSQRDNLQAYNQKNDDVKRNNNINNNNNLKVTEQIKAPNNKLDQSILEYQKYFPLLNYSSDLSTHNSSLLNYLTNQETELIQSLSRPQNNSQQKQLKIKHLEVVSQLINLLKQQQDDKIKSDIQIMEDGHVESVSYTQSEGFFVKYHQIEKLPHDVESIQIEYGIFRKGDLLKTYRQTDKLATISLNWKFNKCIINHNENFKNIYPTQNTFIYFDIKVLGANVKEVKSWSWTLHTLFTEDKKLLQGCFKLPLYSKNHIPHAIFQTGFPFLSECFLYIEVFLKQDYQLGNQIEYSNYVIPKLHLKERQIDQIEEDVVVNQFVDDHIKKNGMIVSTFRDDELLMREYNARQKLKLVKKEDSLKLTGSAWMQQGTLKNIQDKQDQKSYIKQDTDILDSGDLFNQISSLKDKKKITSPKITITIPQEQIQVIPEESEIDVGDDKITKKQEEPETFIYQLSRSKIRQNTLQGLSQTSIKLLIKREASQKQEQDSQNIQLQQQRSKSTISQTMQKILEKRGQTNLQKSQDYVSISSMNRNYQSKQE